MTKPASKTPVSVIITTKNEAFRIEKCLEALEAFDEVIVVDSESTDDTQRIVKKQNVRLISFKWNAAYPKKRQWCLDNIRTVHNFIFFVDADEIITPALTVEIAALKFDKAGYFVAGQHRFGGRLLKHGLRNKKLCLFDRRKFEFPVIDDLDIESMGEMEGHYQPVLKPEYAGEKIGALKAPLIHEAYEDEEAWEARHVRYARWEAAMNKRGAWPHEVSAFRQGLKTLFRALPARAGIAFLHCYILKLGFLDGVAGFRFAQSRARYYRMISEFS